MKRNTTDMGVKRAGQRLGRAAAAVLLLGAACALVVFSVTRESPEDKFFYWIEAESAVTIEPPLEISDDATASGGRCVELKQGMGAAIFGRWGGKAVYEVRFPGPGRYILWARTYWMNGCGNSFFIKFDDELFHFGEDSIFEQWHWVSFVLPEVTAAKTELLTIANREDGIKIDNMLITRDLNFVPQGVGGEIRIYRFNDGAAGDWAHRDEAMWEIKDGYGMDGTPAYHLKALTSPGNIHAIPDFRSGDEFGFRCLARCAQRDPGMRHVRLLFGYRGDDDHWYVDFNDGTTVLGKIENGIERRVGETDPAVEPSVRLDTKYHLLEIVCRGNRLTAKCDGLIMLALRDCTIGGGAFGIGSRHGDVYFDDIIIGKEQTFNYSENFYYDDVRPIEAVRNWRPESGKWTRNNIHGPHTYDVQTRGVAASLAGNPLWRNYQFGVVARGDGESGIGVIFHCIDNRNSYLFRWGGTGSTKEYADRAQLLRVLDGRITVLAEAPGGYEANQWYRLNVCSHNGRITASIDGRTVIDCYDRSLLQGMIGLYVDGTATHTAGFPERCFWPSSYMGSSWQEKFSITIAEAHVRQTIYLCYQDTLNYYAVRWGGGSGQDALDNVRFMQVREGRETVLDECPNRLEYAAPYTVKLSYGDDRLDVSFNRTHISDIADIRITEDVHFAIESPVFRGGKIAVGTGKRANAMFDDIKVSSSDNMNDDFSFSPGGRPLNWIQDTGSWIVENQSLTPRSGTESRILTGDRGWRNYRVEVKCRLDRQGRGEAGVIFYHRNDDTYCLFHMESLGDSVAGRLVRILNGTQTVLDRRVDAMQTDGWHTVRVDLDHNWIGVCIDGKQMVEAYDASLTSGEAGLFAFGSADIYFDDFSVRSDVSSRSFERARSVFSPRDDYLPGMRSIGGWIDERGASDLRGGALHVNGAQSRSVIWRKESDFTDDLSISFDVKAQAGEETTWGLLLTARDPLPDAGYRFLVDGSVARLVRGDSTVAEAPVSLSNGTGWHAIGFERRRGYLVGMIDGECVVVYHERSHLETGRLGIFADGGDISVDNVKIFMHPRFLYDFNLARWCAEDISAWRIGSGNWGVISSLAYGLFGEKDSERDAVLWHKAPLGGDVALYIEYIPVHTSNSGEFIVVLCADGDRTRSGYELKIAYEMKGGNGKSSIQKITARLFKEGTKVADAEASVLQEEGFMPLRIEKRSNTLQLRIGGEHILTHTGGAAPPGDMFALGISGPPSSTTIFNTVAVFDLLR